MVDIPLDKRTMVLVERTPNSFRSGDLLVADDTAPTLTNTLQKLGRGACRTVYALGDSHVLKVDREREQSNLKCYGSCQTEADLWETADESLREFLAPVVAAGQGWLVMDVQRPREMMSTV